MADFYCHIIPIVWQSYSSLPKSISLCSKVAWILVLINVVFWLNCYINEVIECKVEPMMVKEGEAAVEMDAPSTWLQLKVDVHMPLLLSHMTPPISSNQYPLSNIASPNNKSVRKCHNNIKGKDVLNLSTISSFL